MPSIRSLGFELPPLPTVLELPLVLLPPLRSSPLAGTIVASLAAVLLGFSLLNALRGLGLGGWAAVVLTAAALLNPLMLYAVATGAGAVLGVALLVLGLDFVLAWARDPRHSLALFGGAFAVGFASLARYDLVVVAAALTLGVALLAGREPGQRIAYAIAFGTPVLGVMGLWVVVAWLAAGSPLGGLLAEPASAGNGKALAQFVLLVPVMVFALPGAGALAARGDQQARPALVLSAASVAVVGWIAAASLTGGSPGLLTGLALVPLSVLLMAVAARPLVVRREWPLLVVGAALATVLLPLGALASRAESGEGFASFVSLLTGHIPPPMWSSEQALAAAMRQQSQGRDVLLDDQHAFLPAFFLAEPGHLIATADRDFGAVLSDPRGRARLVLVETPGQDDAINAAWPRLYAGGVAWAEQVGEWPASGNPTTRYRLFRVTSP